MTDVYPSARMQVITGGSGFRGVAGMDTRLQGSRHNSGTNLGIDECSPQKATSPQAPAFVYACVTPTQNYTENFEKNIACLLVG